MASSIVDFCRRRAPYKPISCISVANNDLDAVESNPVTWVKSNSKNWVGDLKRFAAE
jgi:hypothetical protein